MKDKKQTIRCSACRHCSGFRPLGNTRTGFTCGHLDQRYIENYFHEKGIRKMPGFLGYGTRYSDTVPVKTSPTWCPEKKAPKQN